VTDNAWLGAQAAQLLDFCRAAADDRAGGFTGLSTTGEPVDGPRPLYGTARMTYGFALGSLLGRPGDAVLAEHGLAALRTVFHDDTRGGWFAELGPDNRTVTVAAKQTYGHAFVLQAACAAAAAGLGADDLIAEAASTFDRWLFDESASLCVDSFDTAWQRADPYRGLNANMHAVEAFITAYQVTARPSFLRRAEAISDRLVSLADATGWRVPEHFTEDWQPLPDYNIDRPADGFRPFGATPGHGLEWSRLLLQLRLADPGRTGLVAAAAALFDRALADGWSASRCGFAYTTDWQGAEVVSQRLHWPLAEAIGAARYLAAVDPGTEYQTWYNTFWDTARRCFLDERGGSWWHELNPDGTPAATIWAGKSDLYHALNAVMFSLLPPAPSLAGALARTKAGTAR
jgi:mannose/cellobiose epimerase-like protein (N-acyl-D-glucosamine 2-epimerase family)